MTHAVECTHRNQTHKDKIDQFNTNVIPKLQCFHKKRKVIECKGKREYLNDKHTRVV
jgi:hypothetical protein